MAKRNDDLVTRLLAGLTARGILLHPATLFVLASMLTIGGAVHLWNEHQDIIVDREDYRLTADKIRLNKQPDWSEADLKELTFAKIAVDENTSLLDTGLVSRTVETFRNVGWVEKVRSVKKSKAGLEVELNYRSPVGMVELNPNTILNWPRSQVGKLLPIDRQAIIMPAKLVAHQPLLRFSVFEPVRFTKLETWTEWPDERIKGCAEISELLGPRWQAMGLYRIVTMRKPNQPDDSSVPYELWPYNDGTQVIWGNPPGQEIENEASAIKKLAALEAFVAKYGPLEKLAKAKIDIRSGEAVSTDAFHTATLGASNFGR